MSVSSTNLSDEKQGTPPKSEIFEIAFGVSIFATLFTLHISPLLMTLLPQYPTFMTNTLP